ncbi:hypothetical protein QBC46DRAFT_401881 [Diplogelasinospora grovesii]|uniref:F-box domain-containing protein n=1 Tax=Diplogelasinospora grovesii TaxID=303347 RepID=A0AAN6RY58_9PEZI|nr:hypothetical protein QBC46DRAFT_401881 [Diplogelasinospora grovesii]
MTKHKTPLSQITIAAPPGSSTSGRYPSSLPYPTAMSVYTETSSRTLLTLPGEIQNKIVGKLEPLDLLLLRATCRHFRNIIPPLNIHELLVAESSKTGMERDLYACRLCLRLRHSSHFADTMMKKGKRKLAGGGISRFCVECGLKPPPGQNGYSPGTHITRNGVVSVICIYCTCLARPSQDRDGKNTQYCTGCWARTPEGQEMRRLKEARLQRELEEREQRLQRELEEREQRRRERRAERGSDAEDTDEERPAQFYPGNDGCDDWRDLFL